MTARDMQPWHLVCVFLSFSSLVLVEGTTLGHQIGEDGGDRQERSCRLNSVTPCSQGLTYLPAASSLKWANQGYTQGS